MTCEQCYEYFKERVKFYIDEYGLDMWDYSFKMGKIKGNIATVNYFKSNKCVFRFSESYEFTDNQEIDDVARHEVIHLIPAKYTLLAEKRFVTRIRLDEELEVFVDHLTEILK